MTLSFSQMVGLASVVAVIGSAAWFLSYAMPRINATFRSSVRLAVYGAVVLLVAQTLTLLAGSKS